MEAPAGELPILRLVGDVAVGELVQEVPNDIVLLLDNLKLLPDQ